MSRKELYYRSYDGITKIHAMLWFPDNSADADSPDENNKKTKAPALVKPRGIIQIVHGMVEHIGRYERFAEFMSSKGFIVAGNDHLGHGLSVHKCGIRGYFAEHNGNECVLRDIHSLHMILKKKYPDLPYFLLGHSMGSFLTRQYIGRYAGHLDGAVIMGTGSYPPAMLEMGLGICRLEALIHGWKYISSLVVRISSSSNNRRIPDAVTESDWLSKEPKEVEKFRKDPLCGFKFTLNGYYNMFQSIRDCQSKKRMRLIPKDLSILLISGAEDPIGDYGAGVQKAYKAYVNAGLRDVLCKLYPGDRHEILNETDRELVYRELLEWCSMKIIPKKP